MVCNRQRHAYLNRTTTDPWSILLVASSRSQCGCEEYGPGIRNNEKNQRSALELYIAPGFAHYQSQAAGNGLIGKIKKAASFKLQAASLTMEQGQCRMNYER